MTEKKECTNNTRITSDDLQNILEVNKRAIEIYVEVEQQQQDLLEHLSYLKIKIDEMDRYLFRLQVILGGIGISTIIAIVQVILSHK